jgi:hypothetical protein
MRNSAKKDGGDDNGSYLVALAHYIEEQIGTVFVNG